MCVRWCGRIELIAVFPDLSWHVRLRGLFIALRIELWLGEGR
ncbi:hypothetical protein SAVIM40S_06136 [Streptomyces avidinii]|uniref:Uncharacterized protein n=1 Tax=Streptomyces avidinii TaxID=1895 RepID=A0ABS4KYH0_STRAV|nr:hypothetical protein [Streptomyces avidinii]